jgi:hypothetical protein
MSAATASRSERWGGRSCFEFAMLEATSKATPRARLTEESLDGSR